MSNTIIYFDDYLDQSGDLTLASVDNYSVLDYQGNPRYPSGQSVTQISAGASLHYRSPIPSGAFTACMVFATTGISGQKIEIRVNDPASSPLWTFTVQTVAVQNAFIDTVSGKKSLSFDGEQDVYFRFPTGFSGDLNWFVFCQDPPGETQEAKLRRMQWFTDSRFGHMMHWGAYSVLGRGEWVMHNENIPKSDYIEEACKPFDPTQYDPQYWASVIESTGQKYLTITTKHHDGFAMFETNVVDFAPYDVVNTASIHASVLRPLVDACRGRGIEFCTYYSLLDWGNVNEVAIENEAAVDPEKINPDDVCRYLSELKEHLKELVQIFDPPLIWFDGAWAAFLTGDVPNQLRAYLRRLSPGIVINNRLGGAPNVGDYVTPEQSIPAGTQNELWETCMTVNDSWSYTTDDNHWKPAAELLGDLLECASNGGNFLLDTGPTADGVIPQPCLDQLAPLGTWMQTWGQAIYGTRAGTLDVSAQAGAYCTLGKDNTLYVIVTAWPADLQLRVDAPDSEIGDVYWLDQPQTALPYRIVDGLITIDLPQDPPDPLGAVVAFSFDRIPQPRVYEDKALLRDASASNVWFGEVDTHGPQFAVDGNSSTRWAADDGTNPVSFEVDLGGQVPFTRVTFVQYEQRIGDFVIDARANGVWATIAQGSRPGVCYVGYLSGTVSADAVRLTVNTCIDPDNPISLYSFSVFDANDARLPERLTVDLARGSAASASDVWYGKETYDAGCAIDGYANSRWACNDNCTMPVFLTINFIRREAFNIVKVSEYVNPDGSSRISDFSVQVLDSDGQSWVDVYHGTDISKTIAFAEQWSMALRIQINERTGSGGPSLWSVEVYRTAHGGFPPLSDDQLLELESRASFEYFWREANTTDGAPGFGLVADSTGSRRASIADSGFALSAIVIAVERNWITRDAAVERCQKSLQALLSSAPQYRGFFYHFIDMDTLDAADSEVSTVDTMLALNGILTAGQYFGGQCADLAQQIFDRVEWCNAIAPDGQFTMSWRCDEDSGDMVMSSSTWSGYAEQFCMYPMAAGSTTYAPPDSATMFYSLNRPVDSYGDSGDQVYAGDGALFIYQFSHAWIDFRRVIDRDGWDWWQNSVDASLANRQFCIDNHDVFASMGEDDWGLTACDGPSGYTVSGAPPSRDANTGHFTDGTITPSGPLGSLPFTPDESLSALRHWYGNPRLWGAYGLLESYNLSCAALWYGTTASGLIKGIGLLMIENYRSGLIWNTYMGHPVLRRGIPAIFDEAAARG
ncbi:alpha-L-fucosidase [Paraburkholderia humisilvae]|uniref:alpha-L-fucosidase n=1 Tax=Paraburkholderia humisilvae TaxID=627669 RepID=A0A6J5DUC7_9BURK|nr:alpha-L-fucosidase [Paraburkholderia humisilvae]CAB3757829.1 hypothetical protein LMG29542_03154 [Paraburkholderia humisilvae]